MKHKSVYKWKKFFLEVFYKQGQKGIKNSVLHKVVFTLGIRG